MSFAYIGSDGSHRPKAASLAGYFRPPFSAQRKGLVAGSQPAFHALHRGKWSGQGAGSVLKGEGW